MNHNQLPRHVAIVMDGNGRWARQRFLPRLAGHKAGVDAARRIVKACGQKQIQVLSLFAFSSENWQRPAPEVNYLMELFLKGLEQEVEVLHANHVRLRFIGDRARFSKQLQERIAEVEAMMQANTGLTLLIAADYGGHWDVTQAVRQLATKVAGGQLNPQAITPDLISQHLSFADLPHPDLFIRTSGELRLSNFMLWQLAYAELYFTDTLWPDFDEACLDTALSHYAQRERRFGRRKPESSCSNNEC